MSACLKHANRNNFYRYFVCVLDCSVELVLIQQVFDKTHLLYAFEYQETILKAADLCHICQRKYGVCIKVIIVFLTTVSY